MLTGKIVRWDEERGFGFIAPDDGGEQVFVHLNQISGRRSPRIGEEISFQVGKDQEGRVCASKAWGKDEILEDLKPEVGRGAKMGPPRKVNRGAAAFLWNYVALAFLMVLVFAVLFDSLATHGCLRRRLQSAVWAPILCPTQPDRCFSAG